MVQCYEAHPPASQSSQQGNSPLFLKEHLLQNLSKVTRVAKKLDQLQKTCDSLESDVPLQHLQDMLLVCDLPRYI